MTALPLQSQAHDPGLAAQPRRRVRVATFLLVAHVFVPYLVGRLRADVALAYLCLALFPFVRSGISPIEQTLLRIGFVDLAWTAVRMLPGDSAWSDKVIYTTNYSLIPLSVVVFVVLKRYLAGFDRAVSWLLLLSLGINALALFQWYDPGNVIHDSLFSLYGGALLNVDTSNISVESMAEFQVRYAGRCTSIFNGMHALGIFDVIVSLFAATYALAVRSRKGTALAMVAGLGSIFGGVVSASKSFYLGLVVGAATLILRRAVSLRHALLVVGVCVFVGMPFLFRANSQKGDRMALGDNYEAVSRPTFDSVLGTRFGSSGFLMPTVEALFYDGRALVVGVGGDYASDSTWVVADSAYVSTVVIGGLVLLFLIFGQVLLMMRSLFLASNAGPPWASTCLAMHVALLAVGIGIPTYQLGRLTPLAVLLTVWCLRDTPDRGAVPMAAAQGMAAQRASDQPYLSQSPSRFCRRETS